MSWRIQGTYFESCNCDAICPCRRIDGVPGGRSTHGVCTGVLSWLIEEGTAAVLQEGEQIATQSRQIFAAGSANQQLRGIVPGSVTAIRIPVAAIGI